MYKRNVFLICILALLFGVIFSDCCIAGSIDGDLKGDQLKGIILVPLEKDTEIQGIYFRRGTCLRLTSEGRIFDAKLHEAHTIQGFLYYPGTTIYFDKFGNVSSIRLGRNQRIRDIEFRNETDIHFNQDGTLGLVILGRDQEIQGNYFIKGSQVYFDETGHLNKAYPFIEGQKIAGYATMLRWPVTFYPSGKVYSLCLAKDQIIQDIPCLAGEFKYVDFYESGNLKGFFVAENVNISDINVPKESKISLYETGQLETLLLSDETYIYNKKYGKDCIIMFDENGVINSVNEDCGYYITNSEY